MVLCRCPLKFINNKVGYSMTVKILSVELSNSPRTKKTDQQRQEVIIKFEALVNDFVSLHLDATITWLQSSDSNSCAGSYTQLTAIVTY